MGLSNEEVYKLYKAPEGGQTAQTAALHEQRLRFHTEPYLHQRDAQRAANDFLLFAKSELPKDKYRTFLNLFKFPLYTNRLTARIYQELEKVFHGRDPVEQYNFTDPETATDWAAYKSERLDEPAIWKAEGWFKTKTAVNSVLVADLPAEQSGELPEPYFYWLPVSALRSFGTDSKGVFSYIMFETKAGETAVFDDERFRVYALNKDGGLGALLREAPHNLGYCPAKWWWDAPLNSADRDLKAAPISSELANLDWLLFFALSKRHLDLYAPYPIYSAYEADCDYQNGQTSQYCDGGYLRNPDGLYTIGADGNLLDPCPACSDKRLKGAGSFIELPIPDANTPDLANPVQITPADTGSLQYNVEEVERLEKAIFDHVTGLAGDVQNKQINETQVRAGFENRLTVLNNLKANLESSIKWANDTVCKLRYGSRFLGSHISMGTDFYLRKPAELWEAYRVTKEAGAPDSVLDGLLEAALASEHKDNPAKAKRAKILAHLQPFRHSAREDVLAMLDKGLAEADAVKLHLNLSKYVERFEREHIDVLRFGELADFDIKIKNIQDKLYEYVRESRNSPTPTGGSGVGEGLQP